MTKGKLCSESVGPQVTNAAGVICFAVLIVSSLTGHSAGWPTAASEFTR